jgi:hypothetical protein
MTDALIFVAMCVVHSLNNKSSLLSLQPSHAAGGRGRRRSREATAPERLSARSSSCSLVSLTSDPDTGPSSELCARLRKTSWRASQHAALEFLQKHGTVLAALVHEAVVALAAVDGFFGAVVLSRG